jgi:Flp pilus assembly pilin Flp
MTILRRIWNDQRGQDLIEYALLAAFVVALVPALLSSDIIGHIAGLFVKASEALDRAVQ